MSIQTHPEQEAVWEEPKKFLGEFEQVVIAAGARTRSNVKLPFTSPNEPMN